MFDEILGLPLHPLAVHAAVVFVPLLAVASLAYALVPKWRSRVGWAAILLAVIAPMTTVVARFSGFAFQEQRALPLEGDLADHSSYGQTTMWVTIALGVLTLALAGVRRGGASGARNWLAVGLTVLVVIAAVVAAVYVFLAGDLGSRIVWEQVWQQAT